MDITPLVPAGRPIVQAYGDGAFRIAGQQHVGSLITFRDRIVPWSGEISAEGPGAACRTWNVLLAEDRRAAAALVAV